jgi:hypothetical protein
MQFTTLDSFSNQLCNSIKTALQQKNTEGRKVLDTAWLAWQLDWLYAEKDIFDAHTKAELLSHWRTTPELETVADHVRFNWVGDVGFSWQTVEPSPGPRSAPHRLLQILTEVIPDRYSPTLQVKEYLLSFAGLPDDQWSRVVSWLETPAVRKENTRSMGVRLVEKYHWLSSEEVFQVLSQRSIGALLIQTGKLNLVPLPETMPRPASFSLPDGSLWIAWPQKSRPTHLHPIVQASLVCHEAAHLAHSFKNEHNISCEPESMWQSETDALREEWNALHSMCTSQPEKLRDHFMSTWYEENCIQQRNIFLSEMHLACDSAVVGRESGREQLISLPFLSAVYACIAEDLYRQH